MATDPNRRPARVDTPSQARTETERPADVPSASYTGTEALAAPDDALDDTWTNDSDDEEWNDSSGG